VSGQRHDEEYAQQGMQMFSKRPKRRLVSDQRVLAVDGNHKIRHSARDCNRPEQGHAERSAGLSHRRNTARADIKSENENSRQDGPKKLAYIHSHLLMAVIPHWQLLSAYRSNAAIVWDNLSTR